MNLVGRVNGLTYLEGAEGTTTVQVMRPTERGDVIVNTQHRFSTLGEALAHVSFEFGCVVVFEQFPELA